MKYKKIIENYQCAGCVCGSNIDCYKINEIPVLGDDISCKKHVAGTHVSTIGKIFLGLPIGFNRLGIFEKMEISIFKKYDKLTYDKFNVPVWKYKDKFNNILVRGLMPRINIPFLHIFLEDCIDKINCIEITKNDIEEMG